MPCQAWFILYAITRVEQTRCCSLFALSAVYVALKLCCERTMRLMGWAPADVLRHYFGGKLSDFSRATQNASNSSGSDEVEEEQAEAMDIGSGPQPAASVMGQQWANQLPQILTFLQQLGLQVSLLYPQKKAGTCTIFPK